MSDRPTLSDPPAADRPSMTGSRSGPRPALLTGPPRTNPFVGPVPFTEADADYFFGREYEARELTALLGAERVVLLYSPSGAGKTSLIQARVVGALKRLKFEVLPTVRVGRDRVGGDHSGPDRPNRYLESALRSVGWTGGAVLPLLRDYLDSRRVPDGTRGQVLVFDQFEEVFTLNPGDLPAKQEFFRQLGDVLATPSDSAAGPPAAARPSYWVLFALREEYLGALDPYLSLLPYRPVPFRINLLDDVKTMKAVQEPARLVGATVTDAAARWVFDSLSKRKVVRPGRRDPEEIQSSFIDPVHLQIVCQEIWNKPVDKAALTAPSFQPPADGPGTATLDRIDDALTRYYQRAVASAAARGKVEKREVRLWIDRYLITYQGLRGTYPIDPAKPTLPRPALEALKEASVLREEDRNGVTWLELAHDRLVRPVKADNDAWYEANLRPVQKTADLWEKASPEQQAALLLRGATLVQAEMWARLNPSEVTKKDQAFLAASRTQWARRQWRTVLGAGLTGLVVLLVGLAVVAYVQMMSKRQVNANNFAARAQIATQTDTELALLYAAGALDVQGRATGEFPDEKERTPNWAAREVAKHVLARAAGRSLLGHTGPISKVDVTDQWVITASSDGTVRLWDFANVAGKGRLNPPVVLDKHTKAIMWTTMTPDRSLLATVGVDQRLCVWRLGKDLAGPDRLAWFSAPTGNTLSRAAFFPADDPAWVCAAGQGGAVYFWRLDGREPGAKDVPPDVTARDAHSGRVSAIGVPPPSATAKDPPLPVTGGRNDARNDPRLLVTSGGNDVRVWRLDELLSVRPAAPGQAVEVPADRVSYRMNGAHSQAVTDVAPFWLREPDGSADPVLWVATSGNDKAVHLWRMADVLRLGETARGLPRGPEAPGGPAKNGPDFNTKRRTIEGFLGGIVDIAVSLPGAADADKLLVSGDADGGVYVLRLSGLMPELFGAHAVAGNTLDLRSPDVLRRPWVLARPARGGPAGPAADRSTITDIDVSPVAGGHTWVTASAESGAIEVMVVGPDGVRDRDRRTVYPGGGVRAVAFSRGPDSKNLKEDRLMLISGGADEVVRVWDLTGEANDLDWEIKNLHIDTAPESRDWKRSALFETFTNAQMLELCRQLLDRRLGEAGREAHLKELESQGFADDIERLRRAGQ